MKQLILVAACASLAACGTDPDDRVTTEAVDPDAPATAAVILDDTVGTYEETADDGTVTMRQVNADGTYTTTTNGEPGESGTARTEQDAICYDPQGAEGETCWTSGELRDDGSFEATDPGGTTIIVRKTT